MIDNTNETVQYEAPIALSNAETEDAAQQEASKSLQRSLVFESGGLILFMSTDYVTEIINDHTITHLPRVPKYIKGIINLRGQLMPVVDIRLLMGKDATVYNSKTCIIILNVDSIPLGIVVDSVHQVIDIDTDNIQPLPIKKEQKLANGMLHMDDGTTAMSFDCHALLVRG